ncbi:MAG: IS110 family transposase [Eggerthellaceae bacterium]|nr:IS110 family transposase [Eggerthellaceae bacterium]
MGKYTTYVGMDVHARSVTCQALNTDSGETKAKTFNDCPSAEVIARWLSTLEGPVYCAYESGCTAYTLCRDLRCLGYDCDIIAVSTLPRSTRDRQQKCDKLDARTILREITNPMSDYTIVWVPDRETEAARDLARLCADAVNATKRAKQQLQAFLLRHGHVWNAKTSTGKRKRAWGTDHARWLDSISFDDEAAQATYDAYRNNVKQAAEFEKGCRELVARESQKPRWKPYVDAIMRLKGLDVGNAFLAAAEFGDFDRFGNGDQVSCWLGTVPRNNSSGEREKHGGITKAGNSHLRRALVEGNASISRRSFDKKRLAKEQEVSPEVERLAAKANARLLKRYRHLTEERGKPSNKAKTAVVNEQIRWIWIIGKTIKAELARGRAA